MSEQNTHFKKGATPLFRIPIAIAELRPDLEIDRERGQVFQYYWGNTPGWERPLLEMENLLNVIEGHADGVAPRSIVLNNEDDRGMTLELSGHELEARDFKWIETFEELFVIDLLCGVVTRDKKTLAYGACYTSANGSLNPTLLATFVRWRWPECRVYSWYIRDDETLILEEPDTFEL